MEKKWGKDMDQNLFPSRETCDGSYIRFSVEPYRKFW
jgi:hypothetical protein